MENICNITKLFTIWRIFIKITQNWKENKKQKDKLPPPWNWELSVTPNHRLWRLANGFAERKEVRPSAYKGVCPSEPSKAGILKSQRKSKARAGGANTRGGFKKNLSFLRLLLPLNDRTTPLPLENIYPLEKPDQRGSELQKLRKTQEDIILKIKRLSKDLQICPHPHTLVEYIVVPRQKLN